MGTAGARADPIDVADRLRDRGLRATSARLALMDCLSELGHATAEQLHEAVALHLPSVSPSTVYRALESLTEHHLVGHAHLGGLSPSYYLADGPEHAHLVCSDCGSVQSLAGPVLQQFVEGLSSSMHFAADAPHLTVQGLCERCRSASPPHPPHRAAPASSGGRRVGRDTPPMQ